MNGRWSRHGHRQRRNSHIVRVDVGMRLRTVPGDRPSPQLTCSTPDEHDVVARWVQGPVVALAWVIIRSGYLHKALVEREIVPDGILPALLIFSVIREVFHDVVIDTTEGQLPFWTRPDGHHYQSVVGKRRLLVLGLLVTCIITLNALRPFLAWLTRRLRIAIAR